MRTADLVVIGAGSTGLAAARAARSDGRSVALVEGRRPGGDCTFYGCVPSKTLLETARRVHAARSGRDHGFTAEVTVDFAAVMRRVHDTVESVSEDESPRTLAAEGIDLVPSHARFVDERTVETSSGDRIRSDRFVLATGARASVPPIPGLAAVPYLTNESVFDLSELPEHLLVIGGGPIGCELAQAFRRLGSRVTVVQGAARLLPKDDADAAEVVRAVLVREGVDVVLGASVVEVRPGPVLVLEGGREIPGSRLLVATGRRPVTEDLDLGIAGVEVDEATGRIRVDANLRTTAAHVWAGGDCAHEYQFTHAGDEMGRIAAHNAFASRAKSFSTRVIPWTTFTEPEVGHVGLTESQAFAEHGDRATVSIVPMSTIDRARCAGETDGFVKLVAAPRSRLVPSKYLDELVGLTVVCPVAGELVGEGALSMQTRGLVGRIAQTVHAYPTWGIANRIAAAGLFGVGWPGGEVRPARADPDGD